MNPVALSPEQTHALNQFILGKNLFITGPGGTGKTLLIKQLCDHANTHNLKYQVCALTGCAALLLNCNARTLHSWGGIKLARGPKAEVINSVLRNKHAVKAWKKVNILIIDEVSMMSKKIFEIIEEIARRARKNAAPFGGMQVIFTGDMFQLPPVESAGEADTAAFCFESPGWSSVFNMENHIVLKTMFRQTDPVYAQILGEVRTGNISEDNKRILQRYVGRTYLPQEHAGCIPPKLFPIRAKVDLVNATMFAKIKEKEFVFECDKRTNCKTMIEKDTPLSQEILEKSAELTEQDVEFEMQQLINNTQCVQVLRLKKGAVVMCTINLDMDNGICNGSQGIVIDINEMGPKPVPVVRFYNGITRIIQPHYRQSEDYPTIALGYIPLCLAWAITIHKIQGATLDMAEIDIGGSVFEYGQTYVALSRIKTLNGLYLSSFHAQRIKANPNVIEFYKNIPDFTPISQGTEQEPIQGTLQESDKDVKKVGLNQENIFSDFVYQDSDTIKKIRL